MTLHVEEPDLIDTMNHVRRSRKNESLVISTTLIHGKTSTQDRGLATNSKMNATERRILKMQLNQFLSN